ncbi:MAG: hypothetical protein WBP45_11725 [Daejeonella sp.]
MKKKSVYITAIKTSISGGIAALAASFIFLSCAHSPFSSEGNLKAEKEQAIEPSSAAELPISEITTLTLKTRYKGFFEKGSDCSKSHDELYGNSDGVYSGSSTCELTLIFNQDGTASKTIESYRYDKAAKKNIVTEKSIWAAKINDDQFKKLAEYIGNNESFKNYRDVYISVVNGLVRVKYKNEVRTVMINAAESRPVSLVMMNAFKKLADEITWKEVD